MILIDTSAWVEFLRDTDSAVSGEVHRLLATDIAICDPFRMQVPSHARDEAHLRRLCNLLARATHLPTGAADYESGATLHRTCRGRGETVRKVIDCLIAAVAVRARVPVLHADIDFGVLARHTPLEGHEPGA